MSFMNAEITDKQYWVYIDGIDGGDYIPADLVDIDAIRAIIDGDDDKDHDAEILAIVRDYTRNSRLTDYRIVYGYGVRSSAIGYMDCTDWSVYTNKREALSAARAEQRACEGRD